MSDLINADETVTYKMGVHKAFADVLLPRRRSQDCLPHREVCKQVSVHPLTHLFIYIIYGVERSGKKISDSFDVIIYSFG